MRSLNIHKAIHLISMLICDYEGNPGGAIDILKTSLKSISLSESLTSTQAEKLRTNLICALDKCDKIIIQCINPDLSQFVNQIGNAVYRLLLALANTHPIKNENDEDPVSLEKITPSNRVFLSTGHEFTIDTLRHIFSQRGLAVKKNPLTNLPFNNRDSYILQFHLLNWTPFSLLEMLALSPACRTFLIENQAGAQKGFAHLSTEERHTLVKILANDKNLNELGKRLIELAFNTLSNLPACKDARRMIVLADLSMLLTDLNKHRARIEIFYSARCRYLLTASAEEPTLPELPYHTMTELAKLAFELQHIKSRNANSKKNQFLDACEASLVSLNATHMHTSPHKAQATATPCCACLFNRTNKIADLYERIDTCLASHHFNAENLLSPLRQNHSPEERELADLQVSLVSY